MKTDLTPCTCVINGQVAACARHDTILFGEGVSLGQPLKFDPENYGSIGVWARENAASDPKPAPGRIVSAEAHLTPTKPASAVPFSGPPGDLLALTHHIDTQPTTEQWQTLKRLILSLDRT